MTRPAILILFMLFVFAAGSAIGQNLQIKNYSLSYRAFEMNSVGNNPTTIAPLLKDPVSYQNFLNTISYNSLSGNPAIQNLHTLYFAVEWTKAPALSRFWKKYSIQTGMLITNKCVTDAGSIGTQGFSTSPDTVGYNNKYTLTKNQQFLGLQIGINRRFPIARKLEFFTGLHFQGSFAIVHYYQQQLDSSSWTTTGGWKTKATQMPDLKGKNFFQWQLMVPLGFEYAVVRNQFFIRLELDLGIVGSQYRPRSSAQNEAHGFGISLIYQPKPRIGR
jgi:hypothetical protein